MKNNIISTILFVIILFIFSFAGCSKKPTTIHEAAIRGDLDAVQTFISKEPATVNSRDNEGRTPMHCAARNGHLKVIQCLIKNGANINANDTDGWTPLRLAKFKGKIKVAEFLKSKGATEY